MRTPEKKDAVRPGRIKLELKYDYDCERDDTNSLLGVLMFGWDVVNQSINQSLYCG